jgi:hypothetical protein
MFVVRVELTDVITDLEGIQGVILSQTQADTILGWLGEQRVTRYSSSRRAIQQLQILGTEKLELLYRASRDGWSSTDFHSKCDNHRHTVTVIKCTGGNVFGGYTDVPWTSSHECDAYQSSSNAFIFALQYPSGVAPVKMPLLQYQYGRAICRYQYYGPTFGGGHDILIADNANSNSNSRTNIFSYQLPAGQNPQTFFTGANHFTTAEIEVFRVNTGKNKKINNLVQAGQAAGQAKMTSLPTGGGGGGGGAAPAAAAPSAATAPSDKTKATEPKEE